MLNHQRAIIYARRRAALMGNGEALEQALQEHVTATGGDMSLIASKKALLGEEAFNETVRRLLLQAYDLFWIEHLDSMDHLRGSVNLRSYGGRDPFIEYRREGLRLFRELETSLSSFIVEALRNLSDTPTAGNRISIPVASLGGKIGRNDKVVITNGEETKEVKFKKAEELLQKGWKIVG